MNSAAYVWWCRYPFDSLSRSLELSHLESLSGFPVTSTLFIPLATLNYIPTVSECAPLSAHPHQSSWILDILTGKKWSFILVLICVSLRARNVEHFSYIVDHLHFFCWKLSKSIVQVSSVFEPLFICIYMYIQIFLFYDTNHMEVQSHPTIIWSLSINRVCKTIPK